VNLMLQTRPRERQFASDWSALLDARLDLRGLRGVLPANVERCSDSAAADSIREIAEVFQMTDIAARAAFWHEVKRAKLRAVRTDQQQERQVTARCSREQNLEAARIRRDLASSSRRSAE
jgi:hypothetical protein